MPDTCLRTFPIYRAWYWLKLYWQLGDKVLRCPAEGPDVAAPGAGGQCPETMDIASSSPDTSRRSSVGRTDLFHKCLPDYPPYGKRILLDNGWYRAHMPAKRDAGR